MGKLRKYNYTFTSSVLNIVMLLCFGYGNAYADQPVIYSKTVINIIPANTAPAADTDNTPTEETLQTEGEEPSAEEEKLKEAVKPVVKIPLQVEVRNAQIPVDSGMLTNYLLDREHGVITYFSAADQHTLRPELIYKQTDVLFIRDDGIIIQVVPEVMLAYLAEDITADYPIRALLFLEAGFAQRWGITPGSRIEHGMFTPRPTIQKASDV